MEDIKYFLTLEKRLGDYIIIDINRLDICDHFVGNEISAIDFFTCSYTEVEIKEAIRRSNITNDEYLASNLKIISDKKHNLPVITKYDYDLFKKFQISEEDIDRDLKNKIFGIYKKTIETTFEDKSFIKGLLDRFKEALKYNQKKEVFSILEEIPYQRSRQIYLSIIENLKIREQNNLRKLEKLDDEK